MKRRCVVCGHVPNGPFLVSLREEVTCCAHPALSACVACSRPRCAPEERQWADLGASLWRCPTCARSAVDHQDQVRRVLPGIRETARDLGFALIRPVRVVLADADRLRRLGTSGRTHVPMGVTELVPVDDRHANATVITILRGLPDDAFGRTVAHELGHAWLGESGARPTKAVVEEGLCELISYAWLRRSGSPLSDALRDQIRTNPDPVYGNGFRLVHQSVRSHGIDAVLSRLRIDGTLPDDTRRVQRR